MAKCSFDPQSFFEQKVVWGDLDSFRYVRLRYPEIGDGDLLSGSYRHVNNVRYCAHYLSIIPFSIALTYKTCSALFRVCG